MVMRDLATPPFDRKARQAALAAPSTGGAVSRRTIRSKENARWFREARG
jgi:hypothetical protein